MSTFTQFDLKPEILKAIQEIGFVTPTPIQAETIPKLMSSNQDIIGTAQTGTGKTAAFGLPAIHSVDITKKATQTLILCPTRELCVQITKDLMAYSKYLRGINILAVYGGTRIDAQIRSLRKGSHIVVGTPGRTKDLIQRKKLFVEHIDRVILDEADEMLTMGFKEDLDAILENTPKGKQTLLFSATMSKKVMAITRKNMNNPIEIAVARVNMGAENVKHVLYMVNAKDRYEVLKRIADINTSIYGIVFCRTRRETKEVANKLMHDGYNADAIHGDLSQSQRDEVMGKFRRGTLQVLVATDVAARGLDVDALTHVINYNLPDDPEIYVHRSGRTGRAGKSGISIAIVHSRDMRKIKEIERISKISFKRELVPSGQDICGKRLYALIDKIGKVEVNEEQIGPFLEDIYKKLEYLDRENLIKHFVSAEFNRYLSYYKNARDVNISGGKNKKNSRDSRDSREPRERKSRSVRRESNFSTIYINVGERNRLTPNRLMGLINEALDSSDAVIGSIDIMKKFSFFEIEDSKKDAVIKALNNKSFEDVELSVEISKELPNRAKTSKEDFYKGKKKKRYGKDQKFRGRKNRKGNSGNKNR
ncbi:MAG: DEAD/DEAH box helicase [Candidatus Marinimicrobia bacterium]|jgi:ATP-dependent RNA helicase DeaD|nr:DEAD/DEAH box helicase [Candidatus Neomarinimicrobiota bacterium]MBT3839914.1 DEAD/DEAH box helicase [Candidatus Neomarinimicrobiota bacterium]MBT3998471.1 DEAD/DEAH box helicase [Candidatus Neomarinimicrobiota bacterium]MBT4281711.1 DEAD/DEAH box helicase [Candidatus Neomarinimicrobiota bacterium]MBT4579335.1 DEAD/DEAH box helicase [Candidatus Neomarinimicrobiota bacterium]